MIRKMTPGDREDYLAMSRVFYSSPAVLHSVPEENFERAFDLVASNSPLLDGYIVESDGQTAGYALVAFSYSAEVGGKVAWLEELYIKDEFRGRGLGSEFFGYVHALYGGEVGRFRLEVSRDNPRAAKLYEHLGYGYLDYVQMYREN